MGCGVSKQQAEAATSSDAVGTVLDTPPDAQVSVNDAKKHSIDVEVLRVEKPLLERQETPVMHQVWCAGVEKPLQSVDAAVR